MTHMKVMKHMKVITNTKVMTWSTWNTRAMTTKTIMPIW
ncbi:hypothetical protein BMS3Bbin07_01128 [bacterium BMS3Bbin07]|nr:hypothetical protein BMS3Bbin07_01128 [bacterium BMS3Bbin07]